MIKVAVVDLSNKETGQLELSPEVFGVDIKLELIHRVLKWHHTVTRRGTAATKSRGEVSGGGKKPWKQKGTGRARAGDNRSPLWRHGGVVFGPQPRIIKDLLPIKVRKLAIKMILSLLVKHNQLVVLGDDQKLPAKTKEAAVILSGLAGSEKTLLIAGAADHDARGFRNLKNVEILVQPGVLRFEKYIKCEKIVTFPKALKEVEAQLLK